MKGKRMITWGGLAVALALLFAVNLLSDAAFTSIRVDLTENRLYTLTDGTRNAPLKLPSARWTIDRISATAPLRPRVWAATSQVPVRLTTPAPDAWARAGCGVTVAAKIVSWSILSN